MSGLHYKKDGSLDMRYSSSKAAMSGGGGGGGRSRSSYCSPTPSYYSSGYGSSSSTSDDLHYKKDGSLDMRYRSSKEATCRSSVGSSQPLHYKKDGSLDMRFASSKKAMSSTISSGSSSSTSDELHYKKDGSLDMRYRSSKEATRGSSVGSSQPLNYKKDGSLDMRYASSKEAMSSTISSSSRPIVLKKDGTPDMRYKSSKQLMDLSNTMKDLCLKSGSGIPLTKAGLPDMRTTAAREWVAAQAAKSNGIIPNWVPRKKDGTVDNSKAVAQIFMETQCNNITYNENQRWDYYERKLKDNQTGFSGVVSSARKMKVTLPGSILLPNSDELRKGLKGSIRFDQEDNIENLIPDSVEALDPALIKPFISNDGEVIGRGSFGIVYKGKLNGNEIAIKKLHLAQLTVREKRSFLKELKILGILGEHPNLIKLHGYILDPPSIVMELVQLGSLSYLLYYCEDIAVEARLSDGRVKKKIAMGIVQGMRQLHSVNVVHGDLKPQNILLKEDYTAKISDFGLATLRGKSSTVIESSVSQSDDVNPGGTAGYMAPELLDSSASPELSSDVYSFGVLLNEIIQEEEPYSSDYRRFHGRGPFAAVNFAKLGNRPAMNRQTGEKKIYELIEKCWRAEPEQRPTFDVIAQILNRDIQDFPNSFDFN